MEATIDVQPDIIPILVDAGCPLEATRLGAKEAVDDADGQTALMIAASWDPRSTAALIRAGASVNARDADGGTPLIYAVKGAITSVENGPTAPGRWDVSIIALLVDAGADPTIKDSRGRSPFALAEQTGPLARTIKGMLLNGMRGKRAA